MTRKTRNIIAWAFIALTFAFILWPTANAQTIHDWETARQREEVAALKYRNANRALYLSMGGLTICAGGPTCLAAATAATVAYGNQRITTLELNQARTNTRTAWTRYAGGTPGSGSSGGR
jgi:hypothetical protein